MIACRVHGKTFAMQCGKASAQLGRAGRTFIPSKSFEIMALRGKVKRKRFLICCKDVDAIELSLRKGVVALRTQSGRPEHQRRVQGYRGKRIRGHAERAMVRLCRNYRHTCAETAKGTAQCAAVFWVKGGHVCHCGMR